MPYTRSVTRTGFLAHGNSKSEERGISRHKSNRKRVVRNLEERNVGTKGKRAKQGLTSTKDKTIELPEGRESPYHIFETNHSITLTCIPGATPVINLQS